MQVSEIQDEKFIIVKNRKLFYADEGKGHTMILLHGYLESLHIWDDFAASLAKKGCRVILPDLPGHGRSDLSAGVQTMEDSAAAVRALAKKLGVDKFFLVGHSLGGYVALSFLELFPEYLSGLCLFHSHPLPDSDEVKEKRLKEIELIHAGRKELIYNVNIPNAFAADNLEKLKEDISLAKEIAKNTPDAGIIANLKGMMLRKDQTGLLAATDVPFLWILGEKDNYIPYPDIPQKVKLPAEGEIVTLKNSGHQGFIEEKRQAQKILQGWVSSQ